MMKPRDLPTSLDLLRGFEASARLLSFTAAAAELFITQSAVSRQVQQLEEQLGVKLFERRTRALVLTDAGDRYYREVSSALAHLREATAAVRARTTPIVRVTTTLTFASLWLVPRLAAFQKAHSDISVHVVADNTVRDLERNSLDVALRYSPEEAAGAGAERLFGEQVAPVCAPALVKGHRIHSVEELLRWPLIEIEDPTGTAPVAVLEGLVRSDGCRAAARESWTHVQSLRPGRAGGCCWARHCARAIPAARPVCRRAPAGAAAEGPRVRHAGAQGLLAGRCARGSTSAPRCRPSPPGCANRSRRRNLPPRHARRGR